MDITIKMYFIKQKLTKLSMKIVVLKFGGTSVGNIDRIKKVAKIIASYKKKNLMLLWFLLQ